MVLATLATKALVAVSEGQVALEATKAVLTFLKTKKEAAQESLDLELLKSPKIVMQINPY